VASRSFSAVNACGASRFAQSPTSKLKRKPICATYAEMIEAMYA
jgi:hypothetical protein